MTCPIVHLFLSLRWDLDTQSTLKTFEGGHVGFVSSLAVVTSSTHNCYVITGGNNVQKDHTLTVWPLVRATQITERHKDQENPELFHPSYSEAFQKTQYRS